MSIIKHPSNERKELIKIYNREYRRKRRLDPLYVKREKEVHDKRYEFLEMLKKEHSNFYKYFHNKEKWKRFVKKQSLLNRRNLDLTK